MDTESDPSVRAVGPPDHQETPLKASATTAQVHEAQQPHYYREEEHPTGDQECDEEDRAEVFNGVARLVPQVVEAVTLWPRLRESEFEVIRRREDVERDDFCHEMEHVVRVCREVDAVERRVGNYLEGIDAAEDSL